MYTRIIAISPYSNEIEIGGALFSKIHQMALGVFLNVLNQKTDTAPKNQFFMINNFAFIPFVAFA